ncbi:branched-chain amino acid aminotransferase [Lentibacillus persicus]|uniref:Branched-chain-amino-acid aminotransferase n=1 Tax=Lentibacillus persicus TaxID=640948 RepID=A0A1I1W4K9_9BACI|nr:branched-chain amino acid aminotransferase [Lentibacillus persicus]SFD88263.1 branched-chain amino acid aminotransferase [Lentibacillus persicus]
MRNTKINIERRKNKKTKPAPENLGFGTVYSDHMFIMDYSTEKGWHSPKITPYGPISLDPGTSVFQYAQSVFDGFKAYRTEDNRILIFRPEENLKRLNASCDRLCIPSIDEEFVLKAVKQLVDIDQDWIPTLKGTSLYIRPYIIATDVSLSVTPSKTYKFIMILSPVGAYYSEGFNPVGINVEETYARAVKGGTGAAKTAGNYSPGYKAQEKASEKGNAQVLWLDAIEKKYIEEVGSMNVFFKINNEVITPPLNGTILSGITRMSVIELLKYWNVPVYERDITIEEVHQAYVNGGLEEVFGAGTAAVIAPIGQLNWGDQEMVINNKQTGGLSQKLFDTLIGIQTGKLEDPFNWTVEVEKELTL